MALLEQHAMGRVGFVSDDSPIIVPVNYVVDGNSIVFRTDPGEKLAEIPMRRVAFEIDNGAAPEPWSVLVKGFGREVTDVVGAHYEALRAKPIHVQAPGEKEHWIAIEIRELSGRRIR